MIYVIRLRRVACNMTQTHVGTHYHLFIVQLTLCVIKMAVKNLLGCGSGSFIVSKFPKCQEIFNILIFSLRMYDWSSLFRHRWQEQNRKSNHKNTIKSNHTGIKTVCTDIEYTKKNRIKDTNKTGDNKISTNLRHKGYSQRRPIIAYVRW